MSIAMKKSRAMITTGGRIVIPSHIRKALNMDVGKEVLLKVELGELHITTLDSAIEHAKALVRRHNPKKIFLSATLIASRREESKNE